MRAEQQTHFLLSLWGGARIDAYPRTAAGQHSSTWRPSPAVILIRAQAVNAVRYHPYATYGIYTNPNPTLTI